MTPEALRAQLKQIETEALCSWDALWFGAAGKKARLEAETLWGLVVSVGDASDAAVEVLSDLEARWHRAPDSRRAARVLAQFRRDLDEAGL